MSTMKVIRAKEKALTDLPDIGKASAEDLHVLGIRSPPDVTSRSSRR